jgi:hypothetical protein
MMRVVLPLRVAPMLSLDKQGVSRQPIRPDEMRSEAVHQGQTLALTPARLAVAQSMEGLEVGQEVAGVLSLSVLAARGETIFPMWQVGVEPEAGLETRAALVAPERMAGLALPPLM